jgi:hypothetical protein
MRVGGGGGARAPFYSIAAALNNASAGAKNANGVGRDKRKKFHNRDDRHRLLFC